MLHAYGTLSNSRLGDDDALQFVDYLSMNDNMGAPFDMGVYFESAVCMGESWNYRDNDTVKSPQVLLEKLVRAVGNGGNLLLNVGPDQKGVIPKEMQAGLATMGDWLKRNGEAIYETEAGPYRHEISWGSITQRKDKDNTSLYLNVVDWPEDGRFTLFGVNNKVLKASLLASGRALKVESRFHVSSGQNIIRLAIPKAAPDPYVSVIKLVVAGAVSMDQTFMQSGDGKACLGAYNATIHDLEIIPNKPNNAKVMKMFTVPQSGQGIMPGRGLTIAGFHTKGQALSWDFRMYQPGTYEVVVVCHTNKTRAWNVDGRVRAHVAGQSVESKLIESKRVAAPTMNAHTMNLHAVLGTVEINAGGAHTLTLEVASTFTGAKPPLRSVMLVPVSQEN